MMKYSPSRELTASYSSPTWFFNRDRYWITRDGNLWTIVLSSTCKKLTGALLDWQQLCHNSSHKDCPTKLYRNIVDPPRSDFISRDLYKFLMTSCSIWFGMIVFERLFYLIMDKFSFASIFFLKVFMHDKSLKTIKSGAMTEFKKVVVYLTPCLSYFTKI